jgi:hypothetical protein
MKSTVIGAPLSPTGLSIAVVNNLIALSWSEATLTPIKKLIFYQNQSGIGVSVQYILSNFQSSFKVPNKDFANFKADLNVTLLISLAYSSSNSVSGRLSAYSNSSTLNFTAGNHYFSEVTTNLVLAS